MQTPPPQDALFRLLVDSVKDYAIFMLDVDGRVLTWNMGAQRIKGYTADEIVGSHFSVFYPPNDRQRGVPGSALRAAEAEGRWEGEGWRLRKDGSRFWANVVITALRDPAGELVGFAKVTRDLTERRRADEEQARLLDLERAARGAAERALEQLRAIQSVTEAALAHLTLDHLLRALLDRITELLDADTAAVLLLTDDRQWLIPHAAKGLEEEVQQGIRIPIGQGFAGRIAAERRPIVLEDVEHADVLNPLLRQKGIRSLLGAPLLVEGCVIGVVHVGTLHQRRFTEDDVAFLQIVADRVALAIDHARLYEAARIARQDAEEADVAVQLRDEFLSVAAHELKTPVTSLQGFSELLLRSLDRDGAIEPARARRALGAIHRQSEQLGRLTTELLETVRLGAERLELDRRPEDLAALVCRLVEQAQDRTDQHDIQVTIPPALIATVDAFRFEQVVGNLLDNAIKYSPNGGRIDVELTQPSPKTVRLSVRDRGIGIPADVQPRIFERFYQAHATSHRSGLGLGLYLSRQIVERHGGQLWVETPVDGGSRFLVELPLPVGDENGR